MAPDRAVFRWCQLHYNWINKIRSSHPSSHINDEQFARADEHFPVNTPLSREGLLSSIFRGNLYSLLINHVWKLQRFRYLLKAGVYPRIPWEHPQNFLILHWTEGISEWNVTKKMMNSRILVFFYRRRMSLSLQKYHNDDDIDIWCRATFLSIALTRLYV